MSPARPEATNAPPGPAPTGSPPAPEPPAPEPPPLACTDAERRAARRHAVALRAAGRTARTETVWVRPAWAPVLAACAAAGVAASVVSVDHAPVALAIAGVALVLALAEQTPCPVLRRITTFARATQNVVAPAPPPPRAVTLVLVARTEVPRGGIARRLRLPLEPITVIALALVTALVAVRLGLDAGGSALGAVQLVPTAALVVAVGLLADAAVAPPAPSSEPLDAAIRAVLAASRALDAAPPQRVGVEIVLAGAGPLGRRARRRNDRRRPEEVAVALVETASDGGAHYATRHPTLRAAAARHGGMTRRRTGAPRAGRRPAIALAAPAAELADAIAALARGLDAELGAAAQPASSERSANSTK
jgi:hypothetical protein